MAESDQKESLELDSKSTQVDNPLYEQFKQIISSQRNKSNDKFRSISNKINIIEDKKKKSLLLEIADQIRTLSTKTYSSSSHFELIELFDQLARSFTGFLHKELVEKFQRILNK